MDARLQDKLVAVTVCEPVQAGPLTAFGLRWELPGRLDYLTLDEALAKGTLDVTEVSKHGSVPDVKVVNHGDLMVFLMAGEQLVGAKQNRVLNASMMVPARGETVVPVSCVERGRWGYRSAKFGGGGSSSHPRLRRMMAKSAFEAYRRSRRASSDQGEVWREVDRKLGAMGSHSPSDALQQAYEDSRARLDAMLAAVELPGECSGVVLAFGGRVVGMELFDRPETLKRLLPKLTRAYALDALEEAELAARKPADELALNRADVETWLQSAASLDSERFASAGLGDDVRFANDRVCGASLLVKDRPVHTEVFAELN